MNGGIILKNTLKGYLVGVLSTVLLLGTVCYATSNTKTLEALYNNIKIYVDGVKIDPKDASGNAVEPFIYNGTTYLPVRAVGEAIGKTVTWDGATQSVYLGEKPGDVQYLMDVCPPYLTSNYAEYKNGESFTMSGKKYSQGFTLNGMGSYAIFNLNGQYKELELDIGYIQTSDWNKTLLLKIYLDDNLVEEKSISYTDLCKKTVLPLKYSQQLRIECNKVSNSDVMIGFGNITVK